MMRIRYKTIEEKEKIISEQLKLNLILVEEMNIIDGNFLIFKALEELTPPLSDVELLQIQNLDLTESVAVLYEQQLTSEVNNMEAVAEIYEIILGGVSNE